MPTPKEIQLEMYYTTWEDSCRNPAVTAEGSLRECRRFRGHWKNGSPCASGFGDNYREWEHSS
jgi:hypothetical protein